jgi:1-acyl-sn-glycerol-3-phosphate acyltransferase
MMTRRTVENWSVAGQQDQALRNALFWLGCSAVTEMAQAGLQMDVTFHGSLPLGPKIFAANHPTTLDPFLLLALSDEPMSILVTGDVFKIPLFGGYLRAAGHIPVIKTDGRRAFDQALALLRGGRTIGIFPEGRLSPMEGAIGIARARSGAARLALWTGAAVVPVGIHLPQDRIRHIAGKIDKTPGVARLVLCGPYAMTVGEPLRFNGDAEDRALVRSVSEQIMDQIVALRRASRGRLAAQRCQAPSLRPRTLRDLIPLSPLLAADRSPTRSTWGRPLPRRPAERYLSKGG